MSLGHGPSLVKDGLVFSYDMNPIVNGKPTSKSWQGKPTTNLYSDGDYSTKSFHPVRSGPWSFPTGVTDPNGNQAIRIDQDGTTSYHGRDITVTVGETYTSSGWIYASPNSNTTSLRIVGEQGFAPDAYYDLTKKGTWQYVTATGTATTTNARILAYQVSNMTTGYCLFGSLQFEQGYGSPFVNGTRSNTQALLDWTGNYTLTASSGVIYNDDGTFSFTSTANTSHYTVNSQNIISGTDPFTIEAWTNKTNTYGAIFGNYGSGYTSGVWFATAGLYISGSVYHSNHATTMAGVHHSVATRDANGNVKLYRDGVLVNSGTLTSSIPSNINFRIGNDVNSGGEALAGNIYSVKVYNKVLTAEEVAQNFQALRGRYGI